MRGAGAPTGYPRCVPLGSEAVSNEWVPIQSAWAFHAKVFPLSLAAKGLWMSCRCYVAEHGTNGTVPVTAVTMFMRGEASDLGLKEPIDELIDAGLFEPVDGGFYFHDFDDHQGKLEARRIQDRERQAKYRAEKRDSHKVSHATERDKPGQSHIQEEKRREEKRLLPTGLADFTEAWNSNCGVLPHLRKPPERGEMRTLALAALAYFDGSKEELGAAVARCAQDSHYQEGHYGAETFARHLDRWAEAPTSKPRSDEPEHYTGPTPLARQYW